MLFMSQSGIIDPARESAWDAWYVQHLEIMASVPGISSAQRFKTTTAGYPRSLALYSVASADVFRDAYYLSVRGMGEWSTLIDPPQYKRNLFAGLDCAPKVTEQEVLIIADRSAPDHVLAGLSWTWLECVGIDRSTAYRGLAVIPAAEADKVSGDPVAVYTPVTRAYAR